MGFKIYTKTGDKGQTSLFGGRRVSKGYLRIDAYGTVDELNSCIGLLRDHLSDEVLRALLKEIQDRLFTLGANLAADPSKELQKPDLLEEDIILRRRLCAGQLLENVRLPPDGLDLQEITIALETLLIEQALGQPLPRCVVAGVEPYVEAKPKVRSRSGRPLRR